MDIEIADITPLRPSYLTRIKPHYCAFPVVGLPWQLTPFDTCEVAKQTHRIVGATLHLIEIEANTTIKVNLQIKRPALFLIFLLSGAVYSYDEYNSLINTSTAPVHYLKYSPCKRFTAELPKGKHSLLIIRLDDNWFIPGAAASYPGFASILDAYHNLDATFVLLPQKQITRRIQNTLLAIRTQVILRVSDDLVVLTHIAQIIDWYHEHISNNKEIEAALFIQRGAQLKQYLDQNYNQDDQCKTALIQEAMGWSSWTLRRLCSELLKCSIPQYIGHLRIQKSIQLLTDTKMQIHDIAIEIGFSGSASFIRAFKKAKGISPNEYRKQLRKN